MIKAGTELFVSRGSYSDYEIVDKIVALRDFEIENVLKEFIEFKPAQKKEGMFNYSVLLMYMELNGYIKTLDWGPHDLEWYVGGGGDIYEVAIKPNDLIGTNLPRTWRGELDNRARRKVEELNGSPDDGEEWNLVGIDLVEDLRSTGKGVPTDELDGHLAESET